MKMLESFKRKKILVIGMGASGLATLKFLIRYGANALGIDANHSLIENLISSGLPCQHERLPVTITEFDFVVVSPGIPTSHPHYREALKSHIEVVGEVELACRYIQKPLLAITGTNGKTTCTLLTTHVLNQNGIKAISLGNIGTPLIEEIDKPSLLESEVIVVELSSFQLETLRSQVIDVGVILNITPDHLDRYSSMDEYAKTKIHLKNCLKSNGKLYVEGKCYQQFASFFHDFIPNTYGYEPYHTLYCNLESLFFKEKIESILPAEYRGKISHEIENLMASYALCKEMGVDPTQFFGAVSSFKKPPHRIEFVGKIGGVAYYNDSKGTNIDAVKRAVETFSENIILIAGGVDKGAPYTSWIDSFNGKVKNICAIGQSAEKMKLELGLHLNVEVKETLQEAVFRAAQLAKPGEIVLLSPGCSSFDMFSDYAERGEIFKNIVNNL